MFSSTGKGNGALLLHSARWWRERARGKNSARLLACFYCQCISELLEDEAQSVLERLESEAETANVRIFPRPIIPFLKSFLNVLQIHQIPMSDIQQASSQRMIISLLHRCIGREPAKPSNWIRKFEAVPESKIQPKSLRFQTTRKVQPGIAVI